ncbi:6622_t:CDS:2, partial [Scutellospora calospora]
MSAQTTSILMAFYHVIAIENWTYVNITNYYQEKIGKNERKKILDHIKKDLKKVLNPNFDFDILRKRKAQEILDTWKNWSSPKNSDTTLDSHNSCVKIGNLQIATDSATQINNNNCQDINFTCDITKGTEDGVRNVNTE